MRSCPERPPPRLERAGAGARRWRRRRRRAPARLARFSVPRPGCRPEKWKGNKEAVGFSFVCVDLVTSLLPYITQTSKLVILFIVMIIVIISACLSHFLSSSDLRAF